MGHIFISHSSHDRQLAEHVATYLERRGVQCWYTPRDVDLAVEWDQAILDGIDKCSAILLLFSEKADDSLHVRRELNLAENAKKFLLTLRIENIQPDKLSYFLNLSQWIDWMDKRDEALDRVYAALKGSRDGQSGDDASRKSETVSTNSIPSGQKLWLRPSSKNFIAAPGVPREKRVFRSDSESSNAVGYLRMRAVGNGRYDKYHEVIRRDGSVYGYFTDGFGEVAYTYGFVSPEDDDCIYVVNHRYRATVSLLSTLRPTGRVWTKMAPKFSVADREALAFEISSGEISHLCFRGEQQSSLFCMNGDGFFLFDTRRREMRANVKFESTYLDENARILSPVAPLVAVAFSKFDRMGTLDNREIYRPTVQIYNLESGELLMTFPLPGEDYGAWQIAFSADGKMLRAKKDKDEHIFEVIEVL